MPDSPVFGRTPDPSAEELEEMAVTPDPIPFTIAGRWRVASPPGYTGEDAHAAGEEVLFEFTARGEPPMGSSLYFAASANSSGSMQTAAFLAWIKNVLVEEDQERFRMILDDPDILFDGTMFMALIDWLHEQWTGRPFRPRSARRAGPANTRSSSRAASSKPASLRSTASR